MVDLRSQNKGLAGCPKRKGGWLFWLKSRGGLVGWPKGRGWLHQI